MTIVGLLAVILIALSKVNAASLSDVLSIPSTGNDDHDDDGFWKRQGLTHSVFVNFSRSFCLPDRTISRVA